LTPSTALVRAASREVERLRRAEEKLIRQREDLQRSLEAVQDQLDNLGLQRDRLSQIGIEDPTNSRGLGSEPSRGKLRGAEIRERAARAFFLVHGEGKALHYRRWFELLAQEGAQVGGKDPLATFLTNLNRSPVVTRGPEPGTYAIDAGARDRLRMQLDEKRAELSDVSDVLGRPDQSSIGLNQHRDELISDVRRLEGLISEADRVLAPAPTEVGGQRTTRAA
jgi:hypothetical protein